MLSTREPPQNKGHIQTKSEGLENNIAHKRRPKESRSLMGLCMEMHFHMFESF